MNYKTQYMLPRLDPWLGGKFHLGCQGQCLQCRNCQSTTWLVPKSEKDHHVNDEWYIKGVFPGVTQNNCTEWDELWWIVSYRHFSYTGAFFVLIFLLSYNDHLHSVNNVNKVDAIRYIVKLKFGQNFPQAEAFFSNLFCWTASMRRLNLWLIIQQ